MICACFPVQRRGRSVATGLAAMCLGAAASAQDVGSSSYNLYGLPGLIEMPDAMSAADAELATTIGGFTGEVRGTLTFQALPRLSGSFRYSGIDRDTFSGLEENTTNDLTYDRSFDVRLRLLNEGYSFPAIAVGLRDLAGTGKFSSEYIAATKHFARNLRLTGGLGWGAMGTGNGIARFGTRAEDFLGEGGVPSYDRWFQGDVAPFGGLAWQATPQLMVQVEYSSDAAEQRVASGQIDRTTAWNAGMDYRLANGTQLSLYALYGTTIGAQITFINNPKKANVPGGREEAPLPIVPRTPAQIDDTSWTAGPVTSYEADLRAALARDGLLLEGLQLSERKATLRFENPRFHTAPQAIGRAARSMARTLPASTESFEIIPVAEGMATSQVTVRRSDLEALEFSPASEMRDATEVADAFGAPRPVSGELYPRWNWALEPYLDTGFFDPEAPVRLDAGIRARAQVRPSHNTKLVGSITKRIGGNLSGTPADNSGSLPPVRTNLASYVTEGDPGIERLYAAAFDRPGPDLYSRISAGYLESMFGGVSGELLWKPVESRLALGVELNHVWQRDFDRRFGLQNYDVTTGHASAYYKFNNGMLGQVDAGRYLAGDTGATFQLSREFANGWRIGAFATFTDVSSEDFGEGSFDKGIILRIPTNWVLGTTDRSVIDADFRPIQRNGGARLNAPDRLYPLVRDYHRPRMDKTFGRFWR